MNGRYAHRMRLGMSLGVFVAQLFLFGGSFAATPYDYNDYTLDAPPEGKKFTFRQARALTKDWDKHGVVRLGVMSDHNLDYRFWSGVQLIEAESKETYNVNAIRCLISFCLYVGKVPPGQYFINTLYAHSYTPSRILAPGATSSVPIRNTLGSFTVEARSLTDLGLIGSYSGAEDDEANRYSAAFLGYHEDLSTLYAEVYGKYQRYFSLNDRILGWDEGEWLESATRAIPSSRMFFADYSRVHERAGTLFFPSTTGAIYALDWDEGHAYQNVGTLFMLSTLSIDEAEWVAGGEGGRIYFSKDRGASWTAIDAFVRDEVVVKLFHRNGSLHALTVSQDQERAKLYAAKPDGTYAEISQTSFELLEKSRGIMAKLDQLQESLTKMFFNRDDLRKVRVHVADDYLVAQFNAKQFVSFDFDDAAWHSLTLDKPVRTFIAAKDGIYMMSEAHEERVSDSEPQVRALAARVRGASFEEGAKLPITTLFHYTKDLRTKLATRDVLALPRGGFYVNEEGQVVAVLSVIEDQTDLQKTPGPQIYSIDGDARPSPLYSLRDIGFFHDSDLLSMGADSVLIDRIAPRVHRVGTSGEIATYRLYEYAKERLLDE